MRYGENTTLRTKQVSDRAHRRTSCSPTGAGHFGKDAALELLERD